jgi:hypothetical protein
MVLARGATSEEGEEAGPPGPGGEGRKRVSECYLSSPLRPGDCPSFFRLRRRQFTGVPHCFIYVWWRGIQCRGVDGCPGESRFRRDVMARPVSVQERLREWRRGSPLFGRRPRADSRGQLTRGRTEHNNGRDDVLSLHASTASGMALQCPGWRRGGGDGRTGLMVTEGTRPTSRHGPLRARNGRPTPFEGTAVLFRGCGTRGRTRVGGTMSRS